MFSRCFHKISVSNEGIQAAPLRCSWLGRSNRDTARPLSRRLASSNGTGIGECATSCLDFLSWLELKISGVAARSIVQLDMVLRSPAQFDLFEILTRFARPWVRLNQNDALAFHLTVRSCPRLRELGDHGCAFAAKATHPQDGSERPRSLDKRTRPGC